MSCQVSRTSYDHDSCCITPVIASFDSDGHIKPLYVRIGENAFKIHSSWLKPSYPGIMIYHCKVIDGDCLKPLTLTYHQRESVWTIPKMIHSFRTTCQ